MRRMRMRIHVTTQKTVCVWIHVGRQLTTMNQYPGSTCLKSHYINLCGVNFMHSRYACITTHLDICPCCAFCLRDGVQLHSCGQRKLQLLHLQGVGRLWREEVLPVRFEQGFDGLSSSNTGKTIKLQTETSMSTGRDERKREPSRPWCPGQCLRKQWVFAALRAAESCKRSSNDTGTQGSAWKHFNLPKNSIIGVCRDLWITPTKRYYAATSFLAVFYM